MCTLIVATGLWSDVPLVVAANRDEKLGRRSAGPRVQTREQMRFVAPQDLEAGGTWLGINACGVFVAITNRHDGNRNPGARSRGLLVLDALAERSAVEARQRVMAMEASRHNPFHLVVADRSGAHLVWSDGTHNRREELGPGIHVVTERSLGAAPSARIDLLNDRVRPLEKERVPEPEAWAEILREHRDDAPLESVCVHAPALDYGTRSSSILYLAREGGVSRFLHADGPPCTRAYVDLSPIIHPLLASG